MLRKYVTKEDFDGNPLQQRILLALRKKWHEKHEGFTRAGFLIDLFDMKDSDINKSWNFWETRHRTYSGQLVRALDSLEEKKLIIVKKNRKPYGYFHKG